MMYEEMRVRPSGSIVRVYQIIDGVATVFDKEKFMRDNQGWNKVKVNKLVPMDLPLYNDTVVSQTAKNKAKKRMHLEDATWKTSDGKLWSHADIDMAVEHELTLMEQENQETETLNTEE